jgi:hypothetical protein
MSALVSYLLDNLVSHVPVAILHGALERCVVLSIDVLKNPVLIRQRSEVPVLTDHLRSVTVIPTDSAASTRLQKRPAVHGRNILGERYELYEENWVDSGIGRGEVRS